MVLDWGHGASSRQWLVTDAMFFTTAMVLNWDHGLSSLTPSDFPPIRPWFFSEAMVLFRNPASLMTLWLFIDAMRIWYTADLVRSLTLVRSLLLSCVPYAPLLCDLEDSVMAFGFITSLSPQFSRTSCWCVCLYTCVHIRDWSAPTFWDMHQGMFCSWVSPTWPVIRWPYPRIYFQPQFTPSMGTTSDRSTWNSFSRHHDHISSSLTPTSREPHILVMVYVMVVNDA